MGYLTSGDDPIEKNGENIFRVVADALLENFVLGEQQCMILVPLIVTLAGQGWNDRERVSEDYAVFPWMVESFRRADVQIEREVRSDSDSPDRLQRRPAEVLPEPGASRIPGTRPPGDRRPRPRPRTE